MKPSSGSRFHFSSHFFRFFFTDSKGPRTNRGLILWWNRDISVYMSYVQFLSSYSIFSHFICISALKRNKKMQAILICYTDMQAILIF